MHAGAMGPPDTIGSPAPAESNGSFFTLSCEEAPRPQFESPSGIQLAVSLPLSWLYILGSQNSPLLLQG